MPSSANLVKVKELFEVNIYCELSCDEYETPEQRCENDLPDYNLIFMTELNHNSSVEDFLKDATSRFSEDMKYFSKLIQGAECDFCIEDHCAQEEGMHQPSDDGILVNENYSPFGDDWELAKYFPLLLTLLASIAIKLFGLYF